MSLVLITGGARSGKSSAAERLVATRCERATVVVCAHAPDDEEMARRVANHRAHRPASYRTLEVHEGMSWTAEVGEDECILVECMGTLVARFVGAAFGQQGETARADDMVGEETETAAEAAVDALVEWLAARPGDTVVVTNEVGSGVIPAFPDGRLFRDLLGRANRRLVDAADVAYLAVAGRLLDLSALPRDAAWPGED